MLVAGEDLAPVAARPVVAAGEERPRAERKKERSGEKGKKKRNARSGPSWAGKERRAQFFFLSAVRFNGRKK
jgi:hypothetical protein